MNKDKKQKQVLVKKKVKNKIRQYDKIVLAVEEIAKRGELTAESVLEEAKNVSSPLHALFEWDNTKAAEQWRLQQARVIVNYVKVKVGEKVYSKYESVNVHVIDDNGNINQKRVYKPYFEIKRSPELRKQMIERSLRELKYWEEQNSKYEEFKPIIDTAQKVRRRLNGKR
jgi:hypothetical protein